MDELSVNITDGKTLLPERSPPSAGTPLVCLNFKVPLRIRQQFKIYAAKHNMTMTDLLLRLLDDCLTSEMTAAGTRSRVKK
jgi:hypothetical protein